MRLVHFREAAQVRISPRNHSSAAGVSLALCGFAANSILCRLALAAHEIDAGSFTALRLASGAIVLVVLTRLRGGASPASVGGNWLSALALITYALPFSWAYLRLGAGPGAFILFTSVQLTMVGAALRQGERLRVWTILGLAAAVGGMLWLTVPGTLAPDIAGTTSMVVAGVAWGVYSLRGRSSNANALSTTAGNFARSLVFAPLLIAVAWATDTLHVSPRGAFLACASGAVASGIGYSLWYAALPALSATRAAIVQLLVPVLAAAAAVVLLAEPVSGRLVGGGGLIIAGVLLALLARR